MSFEEHLKANRMDIKQLGAEVVRACREFVEQKFGVLSKQLDELKFRLDALPMPKDGSPGRDGVDGKDGPPGADGQKGEPGPDGAPGRDGKDGAPGEAGVKGDVGPEGAPGRDGAPGERGEAGEKGADGLRGEQGPRGEKGDPGEAGQRGEKGERGEPGMAGADGLPGKDGVPGADGERGERGEKGDPGEKGEKGDRGERGEPGLPGEAGTPGERGLPGERGMDGKSITVDDVEPVLAVIVEKAVAALPKAKDGESVPIDQVQRMIDEAVAKAMAAVRIPKDGEHGRDALDIEILPAINESRRYARGTYASHNGGLWRAMRSTEGMDGWECIVDGDHEDTIELGADLRTFTLRKVKSSGRVMEKAFTVPVMIYRGVFKADQTYEPGDAVTWDGAVWIAQAKNSDKPPAESWRLAVKRAMDGRNGLRGEKGERGALGRAGRDLTQIDPATGTKW